MAAIRSGRLSCQNSRVSTHRTITGPEDLKGGWFVIDDEVTHLEDVEWAKPRRRHVAVRDDQRTELVAGTHRFTIGDDIELATGRALDEGFRDTVRGYWRTSISIVASPIVFGLLHLVPVPTFDGHPWRERITLVLVTLVIVLAIHRLWTALTHSHDNRVTRVMAGWKLRGDYDQQRNTGGATNGPDDARP